MNKKEHLNLRGLRQIVTLMSSLNKGLSDNLQMAFPNIIKVNNFVLCEARITDLNNHWFAGFFSGEGCFYVSIRNNYNNNNGIYSIGLEIHIGQHSKDEFLIKSFVDIFKAGSTYEYKDKPFVRFRICRFEDIYFKIIPLFKKYKIEGMKYLDFQDFCQVAELIKNKAHLTLEGYNEIKAIKLRMNKGRYF